MVNFMINRACCDNGTSDPNDPKDCLDKWKMDLITVCNEYNELAAETAGYHDAYVNSLTWETKLKRWYGLVETTDKKAGDVVNTLQFFSDQIAILCENSICTVQGLEKITCLVKIIFNAFYTFEDGGKNPENREKGLKDKILSFKKEVECSNASDDDKDDVIKCIETYEAKIIIVCELQNAILAKLLETLKCAIKLHTFFCDEKSGLKKKILDIIDDFELGLPEAEQCGTGHHHHHHHHIEGEDNGKDGGQFPCDPQKTKPKPKFRIGDDNEYYKNVESAYDEAIDKTKKLKVKWMKRKKKSDKKLSQKTSLTDAIRAAEAAEAGK